PRPSRGRGGARADSATSVACHTAGVVRASVLLSFPERTLRALAPVFGGVAHETAELVLPRLVRRSRLYEASAKNLLRLSIELVGRVEGALPVEPDALPVRPLAVRKGVGNAVE